jgi:GTP-binding protein
MVDVDKENSLLFADIPGLIEGASEGKGLGDDFLRHVERTAVLVHLIDIYNDSVADAYKTIQSELKAYKVDLTKRPQIVALTKIDGMDEDIIADRMEELKAVVPKKAELFAISAPSHTSIREMLFAVNKKVLAERKKKAAKESEIDAVPVIRLNEGDSWKIVKVPGGFRVTGRKIERFAAKTDFDNEQGVLRLRDIMKKMGIMNKLIKEGIQAGDQIQIGLYGTVEY